MLQIIGREKIKKGQKVEGKKAKGKQRYKNHIITDTHDFLIAHFHCLNFKVENFAFIWG